MKNQIQQKRKKKGIINCNTLVLKHIQLHHIHSRILCKNNEE